MSKKVSIVILDIFDTIKDFFISWGLKILAVILFFVIIHNILKMAEVSYMYDGEYKNFVEVYSRQIYECLFRWKWR